MTSTHSELEYGETVQTLQVALLNERHRLEQVPQLIKLIIKYEMWKARIVPQTGQIATSSTFAEFITKERPEGLGETLEGLKLVCAGDIEALDLIDQITANPNGTNRYSYQAVDNINSFKIERPTGTSTEYSLRKLRKDRPDLHKEVIAGTKSPHAAMVEAGFRKRSISLPTEPDSAARALLRNFTKEQLLEVLAVIMAELQKD